MFHRQLPFSGSFDVSYKKINKIREPSRVNYNKVTFVSDKILVSACSSIQSDHHSLPCG